MPVVDEVEGKYAGTSLRGAFGAERPRQKLTVYHQSVSRPEALAVVKFTAKPQVPDASTCGDFWT